MEPKHKRHLRPSIKRGLKIICFVLIMGFGLNFLYNHVLNTPQSINEDAKKYKTKNCIAFYPKQSEAYGLTYVENLCLQADIDEQTIMFDYKVEKINDYLKIDYGNNHSYLVQSDYQAIAIDNLNDQAKMIISDYLRYTLKVQDVDYAYTSSFLEETYYPNINFDLITDYRFEGDNLVLYFDKYASEVKIPLEVIGLELGIDLNLPTSKYVKPTYINPNRKALALTFDDGPSLKPECTDKVLDELYKYDSVGTFYVVGSRLYQATEPIIEKGIKLGNEYGSHSCSHTKLTKLDSNEIHAEIMDVVDWFQTKFNYPVVTYRPPYGAYNQKVDEAVPLAAVLWDIDSLDWQSRDAATIVETINKDLETNSVILMHDIHASSVEALVERHLIKNLIDQGYQLVSVSEIAKLKGVELKPAVHLCWD